MEKERGIVIGTFGHVGHGKAVVRCILDSKKTAEVVVIDDFIDKMTQDPYITERKKRQSELHIATVELREHSFPTGGDKRRERRKQARKSK